MLTHQFSIDWLPTILLLTKLHQQAGQQPDNLCGTYWTAIFLAAQGLDFTPAAIAQLAGSRLPVGDPAIWLPQGARSRQDYGLSLPLTGNPALAGTSAQGLATAVLTASERAYQFVPLQTEWSPERLFDLLDLCRALDLVPLCNLRTNHLWGADLSLVDAIAYLNGEPIQPPPPVWNVGHFLLLAGTIAGPARSLILVCDTYPTLGWQGYYLQSAEAVANALNRGDGQGGGVLLFVDSQEQAAVEQAAIERGFTVAFWDNGSPISPLAAG